MNNDIVRRIEQMLQAEGDSPERDAAGIIDPRAVDCNIKKKALEDVLNNCRQVIDKGEVK